MDKGNAAVPAVAFTGEMAVIVAVCSVEDEIVNGTELESTPAFETVIEAVPADAMSAAVMLAVSCVALTNVVTRAEPFQFTTEPLTKFAPFTVSVNPVALHEGVELDEVVEDVTVDIDGGTIVNGLFPEVPPPGPIVITFS
jgi:hypothetical protein